MAANVRFFTACFPSGSWPGLGAASYTFIKEIPIGAAYTIEARIGGWGEKWVSSLIVLSRARVADNDLDIHCDRVHHVPEQGC